MRHELFTSAAGAALLTRDLSADLETREAVPRPITWDANARTIEAVIASDSPVTRRDPAGDYDEVLDPATLDLASARGVQVLNAHRDGSVGDVIGTVEDAWREGSQIIARLRLSARPELAPIVEDIGAGVIRSLSIGYRVAEWRDGQTNGRRTRTAAKWSIHEVSFVPVPADPRARTRGLPAGNRADTNREIRALGHRAGASQSVIDDLIDRGAGVAEATTTFMGDMIARSSPIRTLRHDPTDNPAATRAAMAEALFVRGNARATPSTLARQYMSLTIPDMARELLNRAGESTTALGPAEIIRRALMTTSDFPLLLGDAIGRTLREAYAAPPSGIRSLSREITVADFRRQSMIMLDSTNAALEPLGEHGEIKSGSLDESAEGIQAQTFAKMLGITEKALVNNDIGGLTDLGRHFNRQATAFEANFMVDLLESGSGLGPAMGDGNPLFDPSHGNVPLSGAVMDESSLSAARLAMRKQTSMAGGLISVTPAYVVVPPEQETSAEKTLSAIQATATSDVNPFAKLQLIVEPRLKDPKAWFVVAAPTEIDGLAHCYLAGSPGPQVETQAGWRILGVEVRCVLNFGAAFTEWRSWYRNPGPAGG